MAVPDVSVDSLFWTARRSTLHCHRVAYHDRPRVVGTECFDHIRLPYPAQNIRTARCTDGSLHALLGRNDWVVAGLVSQHSRNPCVVAILVQVACLAAICHCAGSIWIVVARDSILADRLV